MTSNLNFNVNYTIEERLYILSKKGTGPTDRAIKLICHFYIQDLKFAALLMMI
jgi:hypothetical protein